VSEPTPRRLTLADAYRDAQHVIDQLTTRAPSEPSASVEITRNAAGNAQFTVKTYVTAGADEQATDCYDSLNTIYPHVDPKAAKA
jgi:hypothetical protein